MTELLKKIKDSVQIESIKDQVDFSQYGISNCHSITIKFEVIEEFYNSPVSYYQAVHFAVGQLYNRLLIQKSGAGEATVILFSQNNDNKLEKDALTLKAIFIDQIKYLLSDESNI